MSVVRTLAAAAVLAATAACWRTPRAPEPVLEPVLPPAAPQVRSDPAPARPLSPPPVVATVKGIGPNGLPLYIPHSYTPVEQALLRVAFGIDAPQLMYFSDSSDAAILKYDMREKRCRTCFVDSYRVGFLSIRRPGETWDAFGTRIRHMSAKDFGPAAQRVYTSLHDLDPEAELIFTSMLDSARRSGFRITVVETYRTAEREALLLARQDGRTHTATSMHSYGRAVDIRVDDGDLKRASTRADWIRFRRFVTSQAQGRFRLIGTADTTWDWTHIELPAADIGFHSIDEALAFARRCLSDSARAHPPPVERLGGASVDSCAIIPPDGIGATAGRSTHWGVRTSR